MTTLMGLASLAHVEQGGMGDIIPQGDVSPTTRFAFHKRSSFVGPQYLDSIYQTSFLPL